MVKVYTPESTIGQRLAEVQRIKLEIDKLNEQLDEHKAFLLGHAIRNDYDGLRLGALTLSRRVKPAWTYSSTVKQAEARLKHRKLAEQESGVATKVESQHLVINLSARVALQAAVEA